MTSLSLLQLVSPALPVGAFSYSEGLEWLVQNGRLQDEASLAAWLEAELLRGQVGIEAAALLSIRQCLEQWRAGVDQAAAIRDWSAWLLALRDAPELRAQQAQMGRSLLQLLKDLGHSLPNDDLQLAWPIAWAWAGMVWELPALDVAQGYLYGWVANQLSAAVRLVPLGPTQAQRLQQQLLPLIESRALASMKQDPQSLWCGGVGAAMAQLSHAELYSRLFRS
ncbi:MAG: urease accessory protein UreF [Prochlorococcus sp.]